MLNVITQSIENALLSIESIQIGIFNGMEVAMITATIVGCVVATKFMYGILKLGVMKIASIIKKPFTWIKFPSFTVSFKLPSLRRKANKAKVAGTVGEPSTAA